MIRLFQTTLAMLQGVNRVMLDEFKVELPVEDIPVLSSVISQFKTFASTVQEYLDFFNQYSDPSPETERSAINARLENVKTFVQTIVTGVNSRCDGIPALMGNTSSGLNKHVTHWIAEVVKKPDGPYAMILGARDMLTMAETNIHKKDENLHFFERDHNLWMEPTLIQAIYDRAVMNLDQTINRFETNIMWNLIQSANKYKVLSKPFSEIVIPLSNAAWDESSGVWVTDKLKSGFLNNTLTINPPKVTTVFRIISFDTAEGVAGDFQRADAFNTKSKQTDIISGVLSFTQQSCFPGPDGIMRSVISFGEEAGKQVKERDFLWLNESEIAQVIGISDSNYMLDTDYGTIDSLRKLMGLYYVAPIATETSTASDERVR
jgi:hypothetical protein